jgi:hypothetical protein
MAQRRKSKARPPSKSSKARSRDKQRRMQAAKLREEAEAALARTQEERANKIFPRNLTAWAAYLVAGNPVVTRPEDAVANCFPGLELDVRNLDRRFFPGLVFEFVDDGARVAYVDALQDPDLRLDTPEARRVYKKLKVNFARAETLYKQLTGDDGISLGKGHWYLDWIEQDGRRVSMDRTRDDQLGNYTVWRLVRMLEPGPVTIQLRNETVPIEDDEPTIIKLEGWRRRFTDEETGVISGAYQPGELMQGLCSPWQHDFRDCQCFYWAANHPDVVLGELYPGEALPPDDDDKQAPDANVKPAQQLAKDDAQVPAGSKDASQPKGEQVLASIPLDWIRADRSRALEAEALGTIAENRPYQFDAFRLNSAWQELSVVLEGREIGGLYVPQTIETANPFRSPKLLAEQLHDVLAPLELSLTFEYLYARFSLLRGDEAERKRVRGLVGAVTLARDRLMMIAVSEMQHLRWVNQILWELAQSKLIAEFKPVLTLAKEIPSVDAAMKQPPLRPARKKDRAKAAKEAHEDVGKFIEMERLAGTGPRKARLPELRPLTKDVVDEFIAVEHPSGFIDGAYARVASTLRKPQYPDHLAELAMRIASDGVQHETRFLEIRSALAPFADSQYLRSIEQANTPAARRKVERRVLPLFKVIKDNLKTTYILSGHNDIQSTGKHVAKARAAMTQLLDVGEDLATEGIGIPFFDLWKSLP